MPPVRVYPNYGMSKRKKKEKHFLFNEDFLDSGDKLNQAIEEKKSPDPKTNPMISLPTKSPKQKKVAVLQSLPSFSGLPRYRIFSKISEIGTWRPEMRESASFCCEGPRGYLYGGISSKVFDELCVLDLGR